MAVSRVWIAGYFKAPPAAIGAAPVWIAPNDGTVPSAAKAVIAGYFARVAGATPVWIAGYFKSPPASIGATPICISGWGSGSGGGGGTTTSVWSAADATANGMTLSNGGLTVVSSSSTAYQTVRGTNSQTAGKFYLEFAMNSGAVPVAGGDPGFGLANASFNPVGYLGQSATSIGLFIGVTGTNFANPNTGFVSNLVSSYYPQINDVMQVAVDLSTGKMWIGVNNAWVSSGNPATGATPFVTFSGALLGQAYFPAITIRQGASATGVWTLQSTAASQKYAPPSGFSAWDGGVAQTPAQAYLARTVGGNEGGNGANITTLIDGLVSDGVWAKLDALYVLAQQNATDARLNLIGASFPLTGAGRLVNVAPLALAFTSYVGFSGFANGLDTGFNPATATSPKFIQNSASFGVWAYSAASDGAGQIGNSDAGVTGESHIYDNLAGSSFYVRLNAPSTPAVTSPGTPGLYVGDRSSSASLVPYYNGIAKTTQTATSQAPYSGTFKIGQGGSGTGVSTQTLSAAFIGASLGAAGQLALYNRLKTYMDAVAPAHSPEALAYLARTVGGNEGGNATNIATLIDGLVSDGVWAKLDALYVLAQQNATDAKLNLVGTSYSLTSVGLLKSVSFTSYVGFSGFAGAGSPYLDTGFNPATAISPHFVQNSGSFGVWTYNAPLVDALSGGDMGNGTSAAGLSNILTGYTDGLFYCRINASGAPGAATPGARGLYTGDRSVAANLVPYVNGAARTTVTSASAAPANFSFRVGDIGGANTENTLSAAFIGASLGAAGQLALYNRLRTYMTAVGVP